MYATSWHHCIRSYEHAKWKLSFTLLGGMIFFYVFSGCVLSFLCAQHYRLTYIYFKYMIGIVYILMIRILIWPLNPSGLEIYR